MTTLSMGQSGPRTIVNVYPLAQELQLRHKGSTTYKIEGAAPGTHTTLTVEDTFAICRNPGNGQYYQAPVPGSVVADNLIQAWTKGRVGVADGLGPGLLVCAGATPTPEEISKARAMQTAYFNALVNDADIKYSKEGQKNIVNDHRQAAEWLGVKDRKWAQPITAAEPMVKCPACMEEIRPEARLCRHCHTDVVRFADNLAKEAAKKQA